ncbi:MAG: cupin domain-containing protein [Clostridiales bacterium]|nr:cupin domain-containing protein [Clostridiales bacterium]
MDCYRNHHCECEDRRCHSHDHGPEVYAVNVQRAAQENNYFRTALWTGCYGQMTLMSIPVCGEIGVEIHQDTDQIITVEQGQCVVKIGEHRDCLHVYKTLCQGTTVFIPAGTWHNIINTGRCSLKLSSIYAPPHHPWGTVHRTKAEAEAAAAKE